MIEGHKILLQSGNYFDFDKPMESKFTLLDIGHALSRLCRFNGHTNRFYSVAEHSVHVSRLVPARFKMHALMHDAAEAFMGDMASPLKWMMPEFAQLESVVSLAIQERFGLAHNWVDAKPFIKEADLIMLRAERKQLMTGDDEWEIISNVPDIKIDLSNKCEHMEALNMFALEHQRTVDALCEH